ncbi:MAG TPA: GNAT family N-acetyltransferase [Mycobacteriales bacterium]|nr:GNAT family N-acetyltransferase [Mycobacteriales bacterium]
MRVERIVAGRQWHALDDDVVVGRASLLRRPDGRAFLAADAWKEEVTAALVRTVIEDVPGDLHSTVDENDAPQLELLTAAGFAEVRREHEYLIPVAGVLAGTSGPVPAGFRIVSAAEVDADRLMRLDEALRQDVPGTDGWVNEPAEFRDYTFGSPQFDPELYLVAVTDEGRYAGLVRLWPAHRVPRLGLVGVLRWHRRRGVASALLQAAFRPLAARGVEQVSAEADATNVASVTLLTRLGAERTGGAIELRRPG